MKYIFTIALAIIATTSFGQNCQSTFSFFQFNDSIEICSDPHELSHVTVTYEDPSSGSIVEIKYEPIDELCDTFSFQGWTIVDACAKAGCTEQCLSQLPVEMKSVDVYVYDGRNIVRWETSAEVDVDRFIVERSFNGRDWSPIGQDYAKNRPAVYNFVDLSPEYANYYRIKSVDIDGSYDYSKVVVAFQERESITLSGIGGTRSISGEEPFDLKIYTSSGQLIQHYLPAIDHAIDITSLPPGMYIIAAGTTTFKIIK